MEDECKPFKKCFNMLNKLCGHFHKNIIHEDSELTCTICAKKQLSNWLLMIPLVTHEWNSDWSHSMFIKYISYEWIWEPSLLNPHIRLISGHINHWPYWNHLSKYSHLSPISIWWLSTWLIKRLQGYIFFKKAPWYIGTFMDKFWKIIA